MSVRFDNKRNKFVVRVQRDGVRHWGGVYSSAEEAMEAHAELVKKLERGAPIIHSLDNFDLHYEYEDYHRFTFPEDVSVFDAVRKYWARFVNKLYVRG